MWMWIDAPLSAATVPIPPRRCRTYTLPMMPLGVDLFPFHFIWCNRKTKTTKKLCCGLQHQLDRHRLFMKTQSRCAVSSFAVRGVAGRQSFFCLYFWFCVCLPQQMSRREHKWPRVAVWVCESAMRKGFRASKLTFSSTSIEWMREHG